jgi:hypothetical protein
LKFFKELMCVLKEPTMDKWVQVGSLTGSLKKKVFFLENPSFGSIWVLGDAFRTDGVEGPYIQPLPAGSLFDEKQTSLLPPHWMLLN